MADTVITDVLVSDSSASIKPAIAVEPTTELTADPLISFEATPEFWEQFQAWKNAKLKEVLAYLHDNWSLTEVTIDRLVMMPHFVLPDRKNRNLYGQVSPGQIFTNSDGSVVPHPVTGQPMIFTVWRKVDSPAVDIPDIPAEETEGIENTKPEIESAQLAAAV